MPPPRLPSKADVEAAVDRAIARSDSAAGIVSGPTGEPILTIAMLLADAATNPGAPFTPEAILLLAHLMRDDRARYEMVRDKLKKHGIRVGELDKIVKAHAGAGDEISAGSSLVWDEEAPWFAPVDGAALLDSLRDALGKFLVLPEHGAATMALWTLSAYGFDCFSIFPRLSFTAPAKRCGKSTALQVLGQLVPRPLPAVNASTAALFRIIQEHQPTLLLDEADTYLNDRASELRGILNSGHQRGGQVLRVEAVGDNHVVRSFSTWAPCVIAMIGELPSTLADRAIDIRMQRKLPGETVARLRGDRIPPELVDIPAKMARWVIDHRGSLTAWDGAVPKGLNDRAADNWRPLLAVADLVGRGWPRIARAAAEALTGSDSATETTGQLLLADVHEIFERRRATVEDNDEKALLTRIIIGELIVMEERPWGAYGKATKPITDVQLARLLRPFNVRPKNVRIGQDPVARGYRRDAIAAAYTRYVQGFDSQPATPLHLFPDKDLGVISNPLHADNVAGSKSEIQQQAQRCSGVAGQNAKAGSAGVPDASYDPSNGLDGLDYGAGDERDDDADGEPNDMDDVPF